MTNEETLKARRAAGDHAEALGGIPWDRRRRALERMFEGIAPEYERLNRLLSFGLDVRWRTWAARALVGSGAGPWLDLASGTGELATALLRRGAPLVLRADLSPALLRIGSARAAGRLDRAQQAVACEMDRLPFRDGSLAAIGQGFALRHCHSLPAFLGELFRVLRPAGQIAILDMRYPRGRLAAPYRLYFRRVLPRLAALLRGDRSAYEMMVASVMALPSEEILLRELARAGFIEPRSRAGIFGSVRLLTARKPQVDPNAR